MKVEVVLSCMNQKDYSIIERMKITTDVVVVNQCDTDSVEMFEHNGARVVWCNSSERGLSKSRNMALKYIQQDICLLADDDEVFVNGYEEKIVKAFEQLKEADLIFFNLEPQNPKQKWYVNRKIKRLHFYNIMRYGAPRAAFKRERVQGKIGFNEQFGSGARFYSGEDTLFFIDVLKQKMKAYSCPACLAHIEDGNSTWFEGYTEQFFVTKGAVFTQLSKKFSLLLILQYIIRYPQNSTNIGFFNALKAMLKGRSEILNNGILNY